MCLYDGGNIRQTTVANFDGVAIEYFVEDGSLWEVLSNWLKKPVSDTCFYTFAVRWIEPDHTPRSFPLRVLCSGGPFLRSRKNEMCSP